MKRNRELAKIAFVITLLDTCYKFPDTRIYFMKAFRG